MFYSTGSEKYTCLHYFFLEKLITDLFLLFCKAENIRNLRELKHYSVQCYLFTNKEAKAKAKELPKVTPVGEPGPELDALPQRKHSQPTHMALTEHEWALHTAGIPTLPLTLFFSIKYSVSGSFAFFIYDFLFSHQWNKSL